MNTHLHCCPEGTKSKLDKVKEAFSEKNKVSYKTLLIEPDYERYSLETFLIQNIENQEWNIRDKGSKKVKTIEISAEEGMEFLLNEEGA